MRDALLAIRKHPSRTTIKMRLGMSVKSALVAGACCAMLVLVLTEQSATAGPQLARKHQHVIPQCRPWNANATMTPPSSDPWWDRHINAAESAPTVVPVEAIAAPPLVAPIAPLCASAQPTEYEVGTNVVCDTQSQVERFVTLFSGDTLAAINAVNAEEQNPTACALVSVVYLRSSPIGTARHGDNAFEIVRILVVGIDTDAGIQAVQPSAYFSLFGVKEYVV
jgi:hypothetical protein